MTPAARVTRLQLVMVPTTDQDRSLVFYEGLGFQKRVDVDWSAPHRWIELYPEGGEAGVALVPTGPEEPVGVRTGIILNSGDVDATHAELRSRGVDVDVAVARVGAGVAIRLGAVETTDPVPAMFHLRDPDGNTLLVVQSA